MAGQPDHGEQYGDGAHQHVLHVGETAAPGVVGEQIGGARPVGAQLLQTPGEGAYGHHPAHDHGNGTHQRQRGQHPGATRQLQTLDQLVALRMAGGTRQLEGEDEHGEDGEQHPGHGDRTGGGEPVVLADQRGEDAAAGPVEAGGPGQQPGGDERGDQTGGTGRGPARTDGGAGLTDGEQGDASPDDDQGAHPHLVKPGVARLPAALGDRTGRLGQLVGDPLAGRGRGLGDAGRQPLARGEFVPLGQEGGHRAPVSLARSVRAVAARTATAVSALSCLVQRHGERRPFPPTYCQLTTDCCELCRTGRAGPASGPPGRADRQNVREIFSHSGW